MTSQVQSRHCVEQLFDYADSASQFSRSRVAEAQQTLCEYYGKVLDTSAFVKSGVENVKCTVAQVAETTRAAKEGVLALPGVEFVLRVAVEGKVYFLGVVSQGYTQAQQGSAYAKEQGGNAYFFLADSAKQPLSWGVGLLEDFLLAGAKAGSDEDLALGARVLRLSQNLQERTTGLGTAALAWGPVVELSQKVCGGLALLEKTGNWREQLGTAGNYGALLGTAGNWWKLAESQSAGVVRRARNEGLMLYICLKATAVVTKEALIELLEARMNTMKVKYEASKDMFTMMVTGNFQEEALKEKVTESMTQFRNLTVNIVQRGLEIRVDRQSIAENYDLFAAKLLETLSQFRQLGSQNILSMRNRSIDLYRGVIARIKEREQQMQIQYQKLE